ncbi:acetyltransferase [Paenibacillus oleatilyticus]|uniref:acetyltransferase n=1 Tax=Paenibacillus oleatilyticus TaxID=2594886 RepID=UPI0028065A70|nr:acetyltransferase [Paenibacillus oleatilyticus]
MVIFGTGQISEVAHFYLTEDSPHEVVGFTVDQKYYKEKIFKDLPVVPFEKIENFFPPDQYQLFIPISYTNVNKSRAEKFNEAKSKSYSMISYISSKAIYYNTPVGENCFILENNVIQPFAEIGNNVVLWSGNHIGHHSKIMDHCFICSHVVISGGVNVDSYCFIGVNATIRDNVSIGAESVIGAGALVLENVQNKSVYIGKKTEVGPIRSDQLRRI